VWFTVGFVFFSAQRQLGEAKQEVERERTKLNCTVEQLTTTQEHVAHLKEEVRISAGSLYCIYTTGLIMILTITMVSTLSCCTYWFGLLVMALHIPMNLCCAGLVVRSITV